MTSAEPVISEDASEARNTIAPVISSSWPRRPSLILESTSVRNASFWKNGRVIGVSRNVGPRLLTRMLCGASSIAIALVKPSMACLVAARPDGRRRCLDLSFRARRKGHVRARRGKRGSRRKPDPAPAAGHQGALAVEAKGGRGSKLNGRHVRLKRGAAQTGGHIWPPPPSLYAAAPAERFPASSRLEARNKATNHPLRGSGQSAPRRRIYPHGQVPQSSASWPSAPHEIRRPKRYHRPPAHESHVPTRRPRHEQRDSVSAPGHHSLRHITPPPGRSRCCGRRSGAPGYWPARRGHRSLRGCTAASNTRRPVPTPRRSRPSGRCRSS